MTVESWPNSQSISVTEQINTIYCQIKSKQFTKTISSIKNTFGESIETYHQKLNQNLLLACNRRTVSE